MSAQASLSTAPRVAVLGATGSIGSELVAVLAGVDRVAPLRLRLGGRREHALHAAAETARRLAGPPLDVETQVCDVWDDRSLAAFCAGADVVVSVTGPTYRLGARVALAALETGSAHVDVGGDDPLLEEVARRRPRPSAADGRSPAVVVSAGALPGASALVPRHLATLLGPVDGLVAEVGGMERCSTTVAEDMLLSLSRGGPDGAPFGEPLAAWIAGDVRQHALEVQPAHDVPGARAPVVAQPFLSAETRRLAAGLRLRTACWWNLWPDGHAWSALSALPVLLQDPATSTRDIVDRLCRAAELDLLGRQPWYLMRFRLEHAAAGRHVLAELRTDSSSLVTALVAATAVRAVLADPSLGTGFAADLLDPAEVVGALTAHPRIDLRITSDDLAPPQPALAIEEGVL